MNAAKWMQGEFGDATNWRFCCGPKLVLPVEQITMKNTLFAGALCAVTFGFTAPVAFAQTAPVATAPTAATSGYGLLLEAGALLENGPDGSPSSPIALAPADNARRQRLAVTRNAPALARLRAALAAGIEVPAVESYDDVSTQLGTFAGARELARQLAQESDVRAADGDVMGAAGSGLDALALGAQISRGPILNGLVGVATSAIGRLSLKRHAGLLDAAQSREVAQKLELVAAQMPSYAEILRDEERTTLTLLRFLLADLDAPITRAKTQAALDEGKLDGPTAKMTREMLQLSLADLERDARAIFATANERAAMPYLPAAQSAPIRGAYAYTNGSAQILSMPITRFNFEHNALNYRLLAAALRLRAAKLESGQYPETFNAGIDPFSPTLAPLIYRRAGDTYLLYSVGPDGADDEGGEIQTLVTNEQTGVQNVTDRLAPESTGDIVAPIL